MSARKSIHGVALAALAAALAVCAVCAGSALATEMPEWQQGKAKLTEAVATKSKGKVKMYDVGVEAEMECEGASEGKVEPGVEDKTTSWTLSSCKATPKALNKKGEEKPNKCEKAVSAEVKGLTWQGKLALFGTSIINEIVGTGLGYAMTCEMSKTKITDTCVLAIIFAYGPKTTNVSGGVDEAFHQTTLKCSLGGAETGIFETTQLVEATKGSALEANIV